MKKSLMKLVATAVIGVLLCGNICLVSAAEYEDIYQMKDPVSSTLADFENDVADVTRHLAVSGSQSNVAVKPAINEKEGSKCLFIGNTPSGNGYGLGLTDDAQHAATYVHKDCILYGVGKLEFDMLADTSKASTDSAYSAQLKIMNYDKDKNDVHDIGTILLTLGSKEANANYRIELTKGSDAKEKNNGIDADGVEYDNQSHKAPYNLVSNTWYHVTLSFNVAQKKYKIEVHDKQSGARLTCIEQSFYEDKVSAASAQIEAVEGVRMTANTNVADIYFDNVQTTRQAFTVGDIQVTKDETGNAKASVNITNESAAKTPPVLLLGAYKSESDKVRLLKAGIDKRTDYGKDYLRNYDELYNQPVSFTAECTVPVADADTTKAFLWYDLDEMIPYTDLVTKPVTELGQ